MKIYNSSEEEAMKEGFWVGVGLVLEFFLFLGVIAWGMLQ